MSGFASVTVSDQAGIPAGQSRSIGFRPGRPGPVTVISTPAEQPPKSQSEPGVLGSVEIVTASGAAVAWKSAPIGAVALGLTYDATAADLVAQGNWTCRITNFSPISTSFTTTITSVSGFPVRTASFDVSLLNAILLEATALAAVCVRLQSSSDNSDQSVVSWSIPVANLIGGSVEARFNVADPTDAIIAIGDHKIFNASWRLLNLNSNPSFTSIAVQSNPLAMVATLEFDATGALLNSNTTGVPDLNLGAFAITIAVGFDGRVTPACSASASVSVAGFTIDESSTVESNVAAAITGKLNGLSVSPVDIRGILDRFFISLMRLNGQIAVPRSVATVPGVANVTGYAVQGDSLVVTYYLTPATSTLPVNA